MRFSVLETVIVSADASLQLIPEFFSARSNHYRHSETSAATMPGAKPLSLGNSNAAFVYNVFWAYFIVSKITRNTILSRICYKRQLSPVMHNAVLYPVLYKEYSMGRPRKGEQSLPENCIGAAPGSPPTLWKSLLKRSSKNQLKCIYLH